METNATETAATSFDLSLLDARALRFLETFGFAGENTPRDTYTYRAALRHTQKRARRLAEWCADHGL